MIYQNSLIFATPDVFCEAVLLGGGAAGRRGGASDVLLKVGSDLVV
jgi:hypothetical protein